MKNLKIFWFIDSCEKSTISKVSFSPSLMNFHWNSVSTVMKNNFKFAYDSILWNGCFFIHFPLRFGNLKFIESFELPIERFEYVIRSLSSAFPRKCYNNYIFELSICFVVLHKLYFVLSFPSSLLRYMIQLTCSGGFLSE